MPSVVHLWVAPSCCQGSGPGQMFSGSVSALPLGWAAGHRRPDPARSGLLRLSSVPWREEAWHVREWDTKHLFLGFVCISVLWHFLFKTKEGLDPA